MSTSILDALSQIDTAPGFERGDANTQKKVANLFDRAICLKLDMGMLGSSKKLAGDQITVDAEKDRITASKNILASDEFDSIRREQSATGKKIRALCLPSFFKAGIYLLPIASISTADKILTEAQEKIMGELVPAFLAVYPELVEKDKISLRGTFNLGDYPPIAKVRAAFFFTWEYIQFGVPEALKQVDSDIFIREQEKAGARLLEATEQIQTVLRTQMADLVQHLTERLAGKRDGGKPKIFRDSVVDNVKDFLATFKNRNIVDDAELDRLCGLAKGLLDGVDAQALRDTDTIRDRVRDGFVGIKAQLDTMLVAKPSRIIRFEEPEPEEAAAAPNADQPTI